MKSVTDHSKAPIDPNQSPSLKNWGDAPPNLEKAKTNVVVECGWGRLIFGHTFTDSNEIAGILRDEKDGYRDLALYLRDPQVLVAQRPQELFIDPSLTYRLILEDFEPDDVVSENFRIERLNPKKAKDLEAVNRIYRSRQMVGVDPAFIESGYDGRVIVYWVVRDIHSQEIIGVSMGVDHRLVFQDPENGSSLWALAVDPQANYPGIGRALVVHICKYYKSLGRHFLDVSVLHNNEQAIALYQKYGFFQVPVFCVKYKNPINEKLFSGPAEDCNLNPYGRIITEEARRRGIRVDVLDEEMNYFRLSYGGKSIVCRESLSELTTAVAMSRCADKKVTHRILKEQGLRVPAQRVVDHTEADIDFLQRYGSVVVKPIDGEQGQGITIDVREEEELRQAIERAKVGEQRILMEEYIQGTDLRVIVIDFEVVAAAIRKPPMVIGDGQHTVEELIKKQSRRREKATQGESKIPIDDELVRVIKQEGFTLTDVLPAHRELVVRKTANLHTGGTIHDVTDQLHPTLIDVSVQAAQALDIPVVGLDLLVPAPDNPEYVFIEANERPGLANHEPQPTAERFVDLLFPQSIRPAGAKHPGTAQQERPQGKPGKSAKKSPTPA